MIPTPLHQELPERADEDVVARVIHLHLGGAARKLRELTIEENRAWKATFSEAVRGRVAEVGVKPTIDDVALLLNSSIETMLDLLLAYDLDKVLGERETIDQTATDREVYEGIKKVVAAAYPFGLDLRVLVPELIPLITGALARGIAAATISMASSPPMNASRRPTAGPRKRSTKG